MGKKKNDGNSLGGAVIITMLFYVVYLFFQQMVESKQWRRLTFYCMLIASVVLLPLLPKTVWQTISLYSTGIKPCDCDENYAKGAYVDLTGKDLGVRKKCNDVYFGD